jgi:large subunit ribosomal protein L3
MKNILEKKHKNFIVGTKRGMTQLFLENGEAVPVTIVEAGPCQVVQVKNKQTDGYQALQIGYGVRRGLSKALLGHLKSLPAFRHLLEFRVDDLTTMPNRGEEITVETFTEGERVKVIGVSKGKGFQGVVKRHGFSGSPASHGHEDQLRMSGSIGAGGEQHVRKGKKMGGRMGADQVSVANLQIIKIDLEQNFLYIKGALPGPKGGIIRIIGSGELKVHAPATNKKVEPIVAPDPTADLKNENNKPTEVTPIIADTNSQIATEETAKIPEETKL